MNESRIEVDIEFEGENSHLGTLFINRARGEHVSFRYSEEWLSCENYFAIQPGIDGAGMHFPSQGRSIIQCFLDSGPDRWGRNLLQKAMKSGLENDRANVNISELSYILMVSDALRHGALRYRRGGEYLSQDAESVPKLLKLPMLYESARRISKDEFDNQDVKNLLAPGSSLGGARPKAVVSDKGALYMAKFSKPGDEWNVPAWEGVNLTIAKNAGLNVPEFRIEESNILLLRRFDRTPDGGRVPFISALSMMDLDERERAGYIDIVEIIETFGYESDIKELWSRMLLNIMISNVDDHLRNHGFLRDKHGWRLSPLYDLETSPEHVAEKFWCTGIYDGNDRRSTVEKAIEAAKFFRLTKKEADEKFSILKDAVAQYKTFAERAGIPPREIELMKNSYFSARG